MRQNNNMQDSIISYNEIESYIRNMMVPREEIDKKKNLLELGMNSIQIMRLASYLRRNGIDLKFSDLIVIPTLENWMQLIESKQCINSAKDKGAEISKGSTISPKVFNLTDVQYAYWTGRDDDQILGGVGCHAYIELDGKNIEVQKLQSSWDKMHNYHSILRTRFLKEGKQEIMEQPANTTIAIHDLRGREEDETEIELLRIRNQLSHRKLSVEEGQVAGIELSLLDNEKSRIHFDIDLLVADVQSLHIILRDLAIVYEGKELSNAIKQWNFSEYLAEEEIRKQGERESAIKYWEEQLPNLPTAPMLPLAKRPEQIERPVFNRRIVRVNREKWGKIKYIASQYHVTPAMTLLSIYAEIIDRWSENSKFLINIPLFNRNNERAEIDDVVADFTNLLLLPVDCSKSESFSERCRQVQRKVHEVVAHSAYSGVEVQRDLAKLHQENGLFAPVVFASNIGTELLARECRKTLGEMNYMVSQIPQVFLDFQVYEEDGELILAWDTVDELFYPSVIEDMLNGYKSKLDYLSEDMCNWEKSCEDNSSSNTKSYEINFCDTETVNHTLHEGIYNYARINPHSLAVIEGKTQKSITYSELTEKAKQLAAMLQANAVKPYDTVGITLGRGIKQIEAAMAILTVGGAYVPISCAQPSVRRQLIHENANIKYVITDSTAITSIEWPTDVICINIDETENYEPVKEIQKCQAEDSAYIIYTSGTEGIPKGVEISHGSARNTINDINEKNHLTCSDRALAVSSLDFDLSVYDIFGILNAGGMVVMISDDEVKEASVWFKYILKYDITIWNSVPVLFDMLLVAIENHKNEIEIPLRSIMLSGDWIGMDLPERIQKYVSNIQFMALGGATEASIWSNYFYVQQPVPKAWKSIPYGKPLRNQFFRIVDDKNRDVPDWVSGEMWIGGAGVAKGYYLEQELTDKKFTYYKGIRWYKTGDNGRYWPDGNIEFLGRKDTQVKLRGHRIELGEINNTVKKIPGIKDALSIVNERTLKIKEINSYIILENDTEREGVEQIILNALKGALPEYMLPKHIFVLKEFPVTSNGKIDSKRLPQGQKEKNVNKGILSPEEEVLLKIWEKLFKGKAIHITDNYFALGGDSLLGTILCYEIRDHFDIDISINDIFTHVTIKDLSSLVKSRLKEKDSQIYPSRKLPHIVPEKENKYNDFPLTYIQHAYWIGRSGAYSLGNVSSHYYFEIELDNVEYLRINLALQRLIDYHDMLRIVISKDGQSQKILESVPYYTIDKYDLTGKSQCEIDEAVLRIRKHMSHQVIDTSTWPLFDIKASVHNKHIRLYISLDNIILDGYSIRQLLYQWEKLYVSPELTLPSVSVSFRDYVLYLEKIKKTDLYNESKLYWESRLMNFPLAPELSIKNSPDKIENPVFYRLERKLDRKLWKKIKNMAVSLEITPSNVLLTAYAEVLRLWSKKIDFSINITLFNRLPIHDQISSVIGDFTSLIIAEINNSSGNCFAQRCRMVQQQMEKDLKFSLYDGVEFQRELGKQNHSNMNATIPIVFTSILGLTESNKSSWLDNMVYNITQTPQVWLDHQVQEINGTLKFNWDVVEGIFPESMVDEMFFAYCNLLTDLALHEEKWSEGNNSLVKALMNQNRIEANNTGAHKSIETLYSLFEKNLKENGEKLALLTDEKAFSYKDIDILSSQTAKVMMDINVPHNTMIAIVLPKGWEQIIAAIAVFKWNCAYVPIDPETPPLRIKQILEQGNITTVIKRSTFPIEQWGNHTLIIDIDNIETEKILSEKSYINREISGNPDDLAYVIHTSGTTGSPKGVMITHENAVNTILDINNRCGIGKKDSVFALSNMNFDLSVYDIFGMLAAGGTIVLPNSEKTKEPEYWISKIAEEKITVWNTVPAFMEMLVQYIQLNKVDITKLKSLQVILLSGDWIPVYLPNQIKGIFSNAQVYALGGATEASIWSNLFEVTEVEDDWKSIPYGKPLKNQRYYILNGSLENCPTWVSGKLYIGGLGVGKGYLNDKEKTKEKFIIHPDTNEKLYDTGDYGCYWPDGNIEFLGREDEQVKVNGYRIELLEIEHALKQNNCVQQAVAVINKNTSEILAAVVLEAGGDHEKCINIIKEDIAQKLPVYSLPKNIVVLSELPLSINGKVDRKAVKVRILDESKVEKQFSFPMGELENEIAKVWCNVLGIGQISRDIDFFSCGGDSLKAVTIISMIKPIVNAELSITDLFKAPTVERLKYVL